MFSMFSLVNIKNKFILGLQSKYPYKIVCINHFNVLQSQLSNKYLFLFFMAIVCFKSLL